MDRLSNDVACELVGEKKVEVWVVMKEVWGVGDTKARQHSISAVLSSVSLLLNYGSVTTNTLRIPSVSKGNI